MILLIILTIAVWGYVAYELGKRKGRTEGFKVSNEALKEAIKQYDLRNT